MLVQSVGPASILLIGKGDSHQIRMRLVGHILVTKLFEGEKNSGTKREPALFPIPILNLPRFNPPNSRVAALVFAENQQGCE